MTRVKITVLKCFTNEEIFDGDVPDAVSKHGSKCHKHHPGQTFIMENLDCPEGFCNWAYSDIYRDLVQIAWDGNYPWIKSLGVTFSCCTDGQKPVIFRIERM